LKLKCDEPLSHFAFKFKLRRYNPERHPALLVHGAKPCSAETPLTLLRDTW
jgi:hypothetical protein